MSEKDRIRQTTARFHSEMERVLDGTFVNMPAPLVRLLDAIDCEPIISAYVESCLQGDALADFDATAEVERVREEPDGTFGPFPDEVEGSVAMGYLVVQELVDQGVKFHDPVFAGYGHGSEKLQDQARHFEQDVMARLIGHVQDYLATQAAELGIEEDAQDAPAEERPTVAGLLRQIEDAAQELPAKDREDVLFQVEALSDELASENPKRSVVRVLVRGLQGIVATTQLSQARDLLVERLQEEGLC